MDKTVVNQTARGSIRSVAKCFPELPASADVFRPERITSSCIAQTWREPLQMATCITRQFLMKAVIGAVMVNRDKVGDSTRVTLAQEGQKERIGCRTEVELRSNHWIVGTTANDLVPWHPGRWLHEGSSSRTCPPRTSTPGCGSNTEEGSKWVRVERLCPS